MQHETQGGKDSRKEINQSTHVSAITRGEYAEGLNDEVIPKSVEQCQFENMNAQFMMFFNGSFRGNYCR